MNEAVDIDADSDGVADVTKKFPSINIELVVGAGDGTEPSDCVGAGVGTVPADSNGHS